MQCIIQNGRVVLTFSDDADLSEWPTVNDRGQLSIVSNVPDLIVVSADIPDGILVQNLIFDGLSVTIKVLSTDELEAKKATDRATIQSKIDALERSTMLNRGSREFEIVSCQDLAARKATQLQSSMPDKTVEEITAMVLASNIYYGKLVALNAQIAALRTAMEEI